MIFGGQYQFLECQINEDEFKIPFSGNGFIVDDISSGSTSQICIMGMIISLVILHNVSNKFNIARLDEIDGGLDHSNKLMFVDILHRVIEILGIEQLFIISHSTELALSQTNLIQISPVPDMDETFSGANIIYSYKDTK